MEDIDNLPQDLTELTDEQKKALITWHANLDPDQLRRRMSLNRDQIQMGREQAEKAHPGSPEYERLIQGLSNLWIKQLIIMAAEDEQESHKTKKSK
jgi:hypothetical protein